MLHWVRFAKSRFWLSILPYAREACTGAAVLAGTLGAAVPSAHRASDKSVFGISPAAHIAAAGLTFSWCWATHVAIFGTATALAIAPIIVHSSSLQPKLA
jgi:hypothetical protein